MHIFVDMRYLPFPPFLLAHGENAIITSEAIFRNLITAELFDAVALHCTHTYFEVAHTYALHKPPDLSAYMRPNVYQQEQAIGFLKSIAESFPMEYNKHGAFHSEIGRNALPRIFVHYSNADSTAGFLEYPKPDSSYPTKHQNQIQRKSITIDCSIVAAPATPAAGPFALLPLLVLGSVRSARPTLPGFD